MCPVSRRDALKTAAIALPLGLAGCTGSDDDDEPTPHRTTPRDTPDPRAYGDDLEIDGEPAIDSRFDDEVAFRGNETFAYHALDEPIPAHLSPLREVIYEDERLQFTLFDNHDPELTVDVDDWRIERDDGGEWTTVERGNGGDEVVFEPGSSHTWWFDVDLRDELTEGRYAFHVEGNSETVEDPLTWATLFEVVAEPRIDPGGRRIVEIIHDEPSEEVPGTATVELESPHGDDAPAIVRVGFRSEAFQEVQLDGPEPFGELRATRTNADEALLLIDPDAVVDDDDCWRGEPADEDTDERSVSMALGETVTREVGIATPNEADACAPNGQYRFTGSVRSERDGDENEDSFGFTLRLSDPD